MVIFKMAADRYLEFAKFKIFNIRPLF